VVDDTPENLDLMRAILSPHYKVKLAIHGDVALKLLANSVPDLVLLDIMMPDIDGYEVCRRIKANPAQATIPVVMVSAMTEASDDGRFLEAGAADFIAKPFTAAGLLARVALHLRLAQLAQENQRLTNLVDRATLLVESGNSASAVSLLREGKTIGGTEKINEH
jgi:putative two-component system response regulator